jgi:hypothetical protein
MVLNEYTLIPVFGVLILLSETFFYQNYIFNNSFSTPRYSTLSALAFILIFYTLLIRIQVLVQNNFQTSPYFIKKSQISELYFIPVVLIMVLINSSILLSYRSNAIYKSDSLNREMNSIKIGVKYLDKMKGSQINIIVNEPWHYEYLYSIAAFSKFYANIETNIFSTVQISASDMENEFERRLALEMINDSITGNYQNRNTFNPISEQKMSSPIICFAMPGVILPNFCRIDVPIYVFNKTW